ncbi:MAG: polymerase III, subunit gamma and tau protein [Candidatus Amesbacteria bacterium GW2011_GWB1_47_26]|uniref:DNA polymerase III subunit gamma/tau n=1 Tax=Candidatus Amesbacteria bacterium GW2011_GWC2_45_19 TaxID=1618366 RepID=A0A0G1M3I2_9BACT|nr:MAG: polymerase III, subunit gamma and tau protein [Candidatus Amesbacteria bacterium GW2011_GWC2_45_19]KKU38084.1 MAG: polymerase III, subunit gamma and tau protein [Candidatus Amesbacteria bacterium GW2011_GWA1_46_35]KKU69057.1 MAG: polymerase III, subunit gamma and tau protein [Microgenomates group bacterium GW2011_GWC1_47_20]KKU74743.1 MAG: polymerase III, subunit gamma and tau protein [Candidatus Amesbacteria bacterium GW2011_GWB1_47_26]KKU79132.1 MAG: polymerase III, subunit gamma and 
MSQTLYLKYRPQKISELDLVSAREMLEKMLQGKTLPHAWLFSGPRGTGKTSAARILAKMVNGNDKELNTEIEVGSCPDVIEIDAASNRGIDEIRELRDKIKLAPMRAKFKVYIVDEVHMLTPEAANALLKTLEEPPAHAVFVLCTTDPEKLPETVISRCTRIQFKRPVIGEIMAKLKIVTKGEKLEIRNEELEMVAKAAGGSFRDAIKILEQVILAEKPVAEVLGLLEFADPAEFIKLLRDEDTKKALEFINKMIEEGVGPRSFIERCVEELREQLLETMDKSVLPMIEGLEKAYERSKTSAVPQLPLEIFVIENTQRTGSLLVRSADHPKKDPVKHGSGKGKYKLEDVQVKWPEILKAVKPMNHSVEALLRSTRPVGFDGDTLMLEVFYKFHKDKLETDKCRQIVEAAVGGVFGTDPARLLLQLGEKRQPVKEDEDIVRIAEEIFK